MYSSLNMEKQRLQMRYQEMFLQCQLDDLVRNSTVVFDFQMLKQALSNIHNGEAPFPGVGRTVPPSQQNPILFLANYCMSQLYSRHVISKQLVNGNHLDYHNHNTIPPIHVGNYQPTPPHLVLTPPKNVVYQDGLVMQNLMHSPQIQRNPVSSCPLYYFNIEVFKRKNSEIFFKVMCLILTHQVLTLCYQHDNNKIQKVTCQIFKVTSHHINFFNNPSQILRLTATRWVEWSSRSVRTSHRKWPKTSGY